jgi:hypothetical protein
VRPRLIAALLGLSTACGQAPAPPPAPTPEAPADEDPPAPTQRLVRPGPGCSVHGWCWDHPEVQGNTLRGVVFTADGGWLAVGDRGTVLRRGPDGAYALEDPGTRERLRDVARAEDVIVAVGEGGTMLQREPAGDWTPLESPAPAELRAVALSPRRELAAVGAGRGELVLGTLGGELRLERIEGGRAAASSTSRGPKTAVSTSSAWRPRATTASSRSSTVAAGAGTPSPPSASGPTTRP